MPANQLSFFRAHDYDVPLPNYADWMLAKLGIRRPLCGCGDSYESHQHYRTGSDCSVCRCTHYGPARMKPSAHGERSARLLRHVRLT